MTPTIQLLPSARLIVDVIAAAADPARRVSAGCPPGLNGEVIVRAAMSSRLAAVMVSLHRAGRLDLPEGLAGRLTHAAAASTAAAMVLERLLLRLADSFSAAGVEFLVFKGAALARTVYPNNAWRPFMDLDVLIRRDDYSRAEPALLRLGLRPASRMSVRKRLRYFNAVEFRDPVSRRIVVDLHWSDASASWADRSILTGEAVWTETRPFELAGRSFRTLSLERSLVHLCTHWGYHHQFAALAPLLDLLLLLEALGEDGARDAVRLAAECGCERVMALAMLMIEALMGRSPNAILRVWSLGRGPLGGSETGPLTARQRDGMLRRIETHMRRGGVWRGRWIKALCLEDTRARWRALRSFLASRLPG